MKAVNMTKLLNYDYSVYFSDETILKIKNKFEKEQTIRHIKSYINKDGYWIVEFEESDYKKMIKKWQRKVKD
mgnify:CR=1 FL=1|tara:strand:- start:293 stop:508 length:216 start_codon:yes stop_codon:yes gene_type:complete